MPSLREEERRERRVCGKGEGRRRERRVCGKGEGRRKGEVCTTDSCRESKRRGEERCVCAHTLDWLKSL